MFAPSVILLIAVFGISERYTSLFFSDCLQSSVLKIDTLWLEGLYPQRVMGFFQLVFGAKNIPQVEQTIGSFGLNTSSVRVKDGQMSMIEGSSHSTKKRKFD